MPGERTRVKAKCQENAGESRGLQGNARGTYGSGCKVPGECWGMQGNAGNAKGKYGSGCKVPGEYRGTPVELMGVGAKSQGNAGECRGMPGERMGVGAKSQGDAGNARGTYWSGCIVPGECRGLVGDCKGVGVNS